MTLICPPSPLLFIIILIVFDIRSFAVNALPEMKIFTVATEETDGLKRLLNSANQFNITVTVLGLGETWLGGDTRTQQGGGQKIRFLRGALESIKDRGNVVVLFIDGYDVVFQGDPAQILHRFLKVFSDSRVVFSAEPFCWPDKALAVKYPVIQFGKRYLNSGMFVGYASEVYQILTKYDVADDEDDQLYYTNIYLNSALRSQWKMTLDSMSRIFQNLNGVEEDIELERGDDGTYQVYNAAFNTHPLVVHGNGASKLFLNHLANYLGRRNNSASCGDCELQTTDPTGLPQITIAFFVLKPIPFVREALQRIMELDYPLKNVHLLIFNSQPDASLKHKSDYVFMVDADVHLTKNALFDLVKTALVEKIDILTGLVTQNGKSFSNFWGAIGSDGYYARSDDYMDIVSRQRIGTWNVPFINGYFLMSMKKAEKFRYAFSYISGLDADMSFCQFARDNGHFLFVDNRQLYGFLSVSDTFETTKFLHAEMYQSFDNALRYIHGKYRSALEAEVNPHQPCPDVYDYPLMSADFCNELIEEMEHYGQWSSGTNTDKRLAGGYENVPTRDIHMKQIDFERHWLYFLDQYVRPMQEKVFTGYFHKPVESSMMFVVRYKPDEQASLRPHHDASTYSIDVALNSKGQDYEGGGVRFVRYNCTLDADQQGWTMMFPGRLTHLHEGLPTTSGTRYIAVSFLNP